jgi:hypothetical protein
MSGEGGFGGVDPGGGGGRGSSAAARRATQRQADASNASIRLRRRPIAPIGAGASGPTEATATEKHVLQSDFTTVSSTAKSNAVDVVRDADGRMTFFADASGGGSVPTEIPNAVLVTDSAGAMAWLDASAAANGDVLSKRDSLDPQFEFATPSGGGGGGATFGTATIDFGSFPGSTEASVAVTGQASILATSKVDVFIMASDTSGAHTAQDHRYAALLLAFSATTPDVGVGFTIHGRCLDRMQGTFSVRWRWS